MAAPAHVVVVDDDETIRQTLRQILEREGFAVSTCANAGEFWPLVAITPAALVLLDIQMPGEGGISIARRLRSETETAIIMVTGLNETVDRVIGLEVGADDYIGKPFDRRELVARIHSVLRRKGSGGGEVSPLAARIDRMASALEAVTDKIADVSEMVLVRDQELAKLEDIFKGKRVGSCPQCGSGITYHQAEEGQLGICGACGWTHFLEEH
ncbi:putative Response regulator consisting of a CheY-like receiver domain and a winged-helix DNA-binding domain [Candidatus Terasakiella magnetica]|nr:putative Response regulator consisting of a CheY-like receiver domain and a winged-helix DNA-binding domain [Candidatus Terasakiella magnetica]